MNCDVSHRNTALLCVPLFTHMTHISAEVETRPRAVYLHSFFHRPSQFAISRTDQHLYFPSDLNLCIFSLATGRMVKTLQVQGVSHGRIVVWYCFMESQ